MGMRNKHNTINDEMVIDDCNGMPLNAVFVYDHRTEILL